MMDLARFGDHEFDHDLTDSLRAGIITVPVKTGHHISTVGFDRPLDIGSVSDSGSLAFETRSNDREGILLLVHGTNIGILVGHNSEPEDEGVRARAAQEFWWRRRQRKSGGNGSDGCIVERRDT
jgi:hypothetical protein